MPCPFQWLVITDGTTNDAGIRNQVDLLSQGGFCLLEDGDWRPAITEPKGGGVWKDSQLADGRRPADFKAQNVIEQMTLTVTALDQDQLIRDTQELRRLLTKARTFGTTDWQSEPVWIEAQGNGETNMRYAVIWDWRTPNDGNPYEAPFWQQLARAGMDDFTLSLEREPYWRHVQPRSSECLETIGAMEWAPCRPCYLEYPTTQPAADRVTITSQAAIDDLPAGAFTWESWVRFVYANVPAAVLSYVVSKHVSPYTIEGFSLALQGGTTGWWAEVGQFVGVASGTSNSGIDDVPTDGDWHHVAMWWNNAWVGANRYPRIAVDGVEVSYAGTNPCGTPHTATDAGADLYIGNLWSFAQNWIGDIGWSRLSTGVIYAPPFAPPARCTLPADVPGVTIGQWIGIECDGTTIDNFEGTAGLDGTLTNCEFDCDCIAARYYGTVDEYGVIVPTCEEEAYVANKQNMSNITDVWRWAVVGGWTGNLAVGGLPYTIMPINAVNNFTMFGTDINIIDSGPFCSLVFDIGTPAANLTYQWEYWNGAWGNLLNVQDNTNADGAMTGIPLDTAGVRSVHWIPPAGWIPGDPGAGVTGYWVRLVYTASPAGAVYPTQQHRHIYTITWPYLEVQDYDIAGDVTALLRARFRDESDHPLGGAAVPAWSNRLILGLRSLSRGSNFAAYINLANEQNPPGITITPAGPGIATFITNVIAPSGECVQVAAFGGLPVAVVTLTLDNTIAQEYLGKYHMFLRGIQSGGASGDVTFRVVFYAGTFATIFYDSGHVPFPYANAYQIVDLGVLSVPAELIQQGAEIQGMIIFQGNGVLTADLYDLILMPTDEWALDTLDWANSSWGYNGCRDSSDIPASTYLDVDAISLPKINTYLTKTYYATEISSIWQGITSTHPMLQANADQRLWTLSTRFPSNLSPEQRSEQHVAFSTWCDKVQRYYSMRGDR